MAKKVLPSPEALRQLLRYEPDTGKLFWRPRPEAMFATKRAFGLWNTRFAGEEAFTQAEASGYKVGRLFGERYKAHRVIWAIVFGREPANCIDHVNGNPRDNRLTNLREASSAENARNRKARAGSASGLRGVVWHKNTSSWAAVIGLNGKSMHLGLFASQTDAAKAYDAAARKYHGEFARPNFAE